MPEGVEILIQVNKLKKLCLNKTIVKIEWNKSFQKKGVKNAEIVKLPLKVENIINRGKVIIFKTTDSENNTLYMTSQLGMSGHWVTAPKNHSNFCLGFGEKHPEMEGYYNITQTIWYQDTRRFGIIGFYRELDQIFKRHGPCMMSTALVVFEKTQKTQKTELHPFQETVDLNYYKNQIRNKRFKNKRIAEFMMDQTRVSGVGNYLRAEILYQSKISPWRLLNSLTDDDITTLYKNTLDVMYRAYVLKGKYFVGEKCGERFELKVYKKQYDPNGYIVLTSPDKNKRMCYYVNEVQK